MDEYIRSQGKRLFTMAIAAMIGSLIQLISSDKAQTVEIAAIHAEVSQLQVEVFLLRKVYMTFGNRGSI